MGNPEEAGYAISHHFVVFITINVQSITLLQFIFYFLSHLEQWLSLCCLLDSADVLEALLLLPNGPEFDEDFGSFLACVELNRSPNDEVTITIMSTQASIQPG